MSSHLEYPHIELTGKIAIGTHYAKGLLTRFVAETLMCGIIFVS